MAWTTPRTWVDLEVVTASIMNTHVRDNLDYLKASPALTSPTFAGDIGLAATKKLYLDGVAMTGDTYIVESAGNTLSFYAGGTEQLKLTASAATVAGTLGVTGLTTLTGGLASPSTFKTATAANTDNAGFYNPTDGYYIIQFKNAAGAGQGGLYYNGANTTMVFDSKLAFTAGNGLVVGAIGSLPTGGWKGAGTINVSGDLYKNNTAYTNPDYVLEHWATGQIVQFADREGAAHYEGLKPLTHVEAFIRQTCVLPRIADWRAGKSGSGGIFGGGDALLASVEEAYLYLFQHDAELSALRARVAELEGKIALLSHN